VRRNLLLILVLGLAGTGTELILLEHYETRWQLVPLGLIAVAILTVILHVVSRSRASVRALQAVMALCVAAGGVGVVQHYRGNQEFELEMYPDIRGYELFSKSITGATPALAPGTLSLLGLIGLVYTQGHPRLHPTFDTQAEEEVRNA
jgi:hypothetical protein